MTKQVDGAAQAQDIPQQAAGSPPPLPGKRVRTRKPPAPGAAADHAVHHAAAGTRTYPCSGCGASLEYGIAEQKLACRHCGRLEDLLESTGPAPTMHDVHSPTAAPEDEGPQVVGEMEVVCQGCGGHTTFTGTLTSTRCPYCATPIQREDVHDAPSRVPVDGVLPFRVDAKAAEAAVEKWVNGRWFAPSEFKTYRQTGSLASVYCSYFVYDAHTTTSYSGRRGENYTVTVGEGDNQRQETRTNWYGVSGVVGNEFDDLCVLANDGLDRDRVQELEPWPTAEAAPFSAEYLAGHLSRTYDRDVSVCVEEAKERMQPAIESSIRSDIGGDQQQISDQHTTYSSLGYQHLLLPVWLLTVRYDGRPFQVFLNGVTGEVQGDRPYSKVKVATAVLVALLLLAVLVALFAG